MIILGLHYGHDGSACIVKNGRLVSFLASERLTRAKKSGGVQDYVMDAVLATAGVTVEQIEKQYDIHGNQIGALVVKR